MKLLKLSYLLVVIVFLGSCQLAKFDRVPGEELVNIPVEFHGRFAMAPMDNKGILGSDSIYLVIESNVIQVISKSINFTKIHNQDFKTSKFRGKILFALNDPTIPSLWNLFILENQKSHIRIYPLLDKRTNMEEAGKIGNYMPQQMLNITSDPIPPPQYPMSEAGAAPIASPNQGLPSRVFFFTMMEDQFEQYTTNEIIGKEYYQFNKIEVKAKKK
jgi:hypothetical protein